MVCMGNICRSPTAEGMVRSKLAQRDASLLQIEVDSAGTHAYHVDHPPDSRAEDAALNRGIIIGGQKARKVTTQDFHDFDLILAMDQANLTALQDIAPADAKARVEKIMGYSNLGITDDVPDPYYGGLHGFEQVLDLLDNAVDGLLDSLESAPDA